MENRGRFPTFDSGSHYGIQGTQISDTNNAKNFMLDEIMMGTEPHINSQIQQYEGPLPDLGTEDFATMSDQDFLALFAQCNAAPNNGTPSANANAGPAAHAYGPVPDSAVLAATATKDPNYHESENADVSSSYLSIIQGNSVGNPADNGFVPLTDLKVVNQHAEALVVTLGHIRVQALGGLDFLRQLHNQSLNFYMDCLRKPNDGGDDSWQRYLEEMRLSYNMLRDYQMQSYKTMCGSIRIWLRYYYKVVNPETLRRTSEELRQFVDIQRQVVGYRLPEWQNHPALVMKQEKTCPSS
ncbi:hypothetical protein LOZ66_000825 [Ophidiomyces ophidiicola]|nr:hypothetical protein LOZ66_000825 [Ophidiomyces ophidiicola]